MVKAFILSFLCIFLMGAGSMQSCSEEPTERGDELAAQFLKAITYEDMEAVGKLWAGEMEEKAIQLFERTFQYWDRRQVTAFRKIGEEHYEEDFAKKTGRHSISISGLQRK